MPIIPLILLQEGIDVHSKFLNLLKKLKKPKYNTMNTTQEKALAWWNAQSEEYHNSINWPQVMRECTTEHCIAVLYLKEKKDDLLICMEDDIQFISAGTETPEQRFKRIKRSISPEQFEKEMMSFPVNEEDVQFVPPGTYKSSTSTTETVVERAAKEHAYRRFKDSVNVDHFNPLKVAEDFEAGAKWETSRHNSKCENNWQSLCALRNALQRDISSLTPDVLHLLPLVDQCLLENRPETIVP